jgi:LacI family transcriptional regulator
MAITIRDLAKQLNLSITTVSRAIDGYTDVAESTRQRVIHAAREMGYTPNQAARQLRTQQAEAIGFILPGRSPRFTDPFFSEFIAGMGDAVAGGKYNLLISSAPPGELAEQELYRHWITARKVDGFVLNRMRLRDWRVQFLVEQHFPFVTLERSQDPFDYPCVTVDGEKSIQRLIHYLVESGRHRIAYVGGLPDLVIHVDRFKGYLQGLEEEGIAIDDQLIVPADLSRQGGYQAAEGLLAMSTPPDAIVCVNDLTAIGVLAAARVHGVVVGRELAVTGFDGIEEACHSQPPLTTLSQSVYSISQTMAKMLMTLINGEPPEQPCRSFDPELIIRESTAGPAAGE